MAFVRRKFPKILRQSFCLCDGWMRLIFRATHFELLCPNVLRCCLGPASVSVTSVAFAIGFELDLLFSPLRAAASPVLLRSLSVLSLLLRAQQQNKKQKRESGVLWDVGASPGTADSVNFYSICEAMNKHLAHSFVRELCRPPPRTPQKIVRAKIIRVGQV